MWIAPRALSCFPVFGKEGDRLGLWMRAGNICTLYILSFSPVSGNEVGQWRTQKHIILLCFYILGYGCICMYVKQKALAHCASFN